eukprot:8958228-Pyramimonas_sp.AAC.1
MVRRAELDSARDRGAGAERPRRSDDAGKRSAPWTRPIPGTRPLGVRDLSLPRARRAVSEPCPFSPRVRIEPPFESSLPGPTVEPPEAPDEQDASLLAELEAWFPAISVPDCLGLCYYAAEHFTGVTDTAAPAKPRGAE